MVVVLMFQNACILVVLNSMILNSKSDDEC